MVQMLVGPVLTEMEAHVSGALTVRTIQCLPGFVFRQIGKPATNPAQFLCQGRIDEHVERVAPVLKNALACPPDDDAVSNFSGFLDEAGGQGGNGIRVERVKAWPREDAAQPALLPERPRQPVKPGIKAFVVLCRHCGFYSGRLRDLFNQAAVQQLPAEALGEQLANPPAAAAVLPCHGHNPEHAPPPTW